MPVPSNHISNSLFSRQFRSDVFFLFDALMTDEAFWCQFMIKCWLKPYQRQKKLRDTRKVKSWQCRLFKQQLWTEKSSMKLLLHLWVSKSDSVCVGFTNFPFNRIRNFFDESAINRKLHNDLKFIFHENFKWPHKRPSDAIFSGHKESMLESFSRDRKLKIHDGLLLKDE